MNKSEILSLMTAPWSSYDEAKARSARIDELLGFELAACESEIAKTRGRVVGSEHEDWSHLPAQAFLTPYPELADMIRRIQGASAMDWVDLGAGYGRLGLMLDWLRPQDRFQGFELVPERVRESRRVLAKWNCQKSEMSTQDLLAEGFRLPAADVYFIFDFGKTRQIARLVEQLRELSRRRPIAVFGRGRATRHLIATEHPWLAQVEEPLHTEHWSLYRSSGESPGGKRARDVF